MAQVDAQEAIAVMIDDPAAGEDQPPQATDRDMSAGEALAARAWRFVMSVPSIDVLPNADRTEIAFAGRSNVGKSSLLNAIMRHKGLARTSNTPGRTQELNFFVGQHANPSFFLVDMPGYGFAKAPKDKVATWTKLVRSYLRGRQTLARVFLLIDARHGAKPIDLELMTLLDDAAVTWQAVLTKADKIPPTTLARVLAQTTELVRRHPAAFPEVVATSSETGEGIELLRTMMAEIVAQRP